MFRVHHYDFSLILEPHKGGIFHSVNFTYTDTLVYIIFVDLQCTMWHQWNIILDIQLIHLQFVAGYGSLPRANHSAPLSDSRLDGGLLVDTPLSSPYCPDNTLPLLETVSEDQEICNKHRTPVLASQGTPSVHCSETPGGSLVSELMPSLSLLAHSTSYFSNFFQWGFLGVIHLPDHPKPYIKMWNNQFTTYTWL